MIIGLTGSMGCGKGEVVEILKQLGFKHITLSSMIREEASKRGLSQDREVLMKIGNELRSKDGAGVLAKKSLHKIKEEGGEDWVIDGIRNPAEIESLKIGDGVHIVGIVADRSILIDRIISRSREGDSISRDDIVEKIEKEWGKGQPEDGQQVEKCMGMVDAALRNEGTIDELHQNVHELLDVLINE